ncbi:MAG: fibro-slime domain-containing protein [Fibrobacteres bacterium]|jgi:fibro-slime domain-containing protein|nr:fibro-slime domain-containing protein [Fibrobacterota bacterium]
MRKNTWLLAIPIFLSVIALGATRAQAQNPTDSLGGRTVHVFLPSPAIDTLVIQNLNITMKQDAQYWYSYTFTKSGLYDNIDGFYFTDVQHRIFFSKSGLGGTEAPRFLLADFKGAKEIWIIVDPAGPSTAPPVIMLHAPNTINVLNPWTTTAPKLISGAKTRNMTTVDGRCGWFSAMLLDTTMTQGYFEEVNNTDSYGKGGLGSKDPFDFTTLFTANGPLIWLNTQANAWTAVFPGVVGQCTYQMAVTVRDFSSAHPDFDFGSVTGDHSVLGVVQSTIGPDPGRKPVLSATIPKPDPTISFAHFNDWWVTDSTRPAPLQNYESCYDITMSKASDGGWEYDSYRDSPDHGFWPVEGTKNRFNETMASCYVKPPPDSTSWVTGGPKRNGNFCMESHAKFIYQPGQTFEFRGDDDVWVFINNKLVVDLGGVHVPKSATVNMATQGLTAGNSYNWDLFYCDRQPCGSSLRIKTSIYFKQQLALYGIDIPGADPGSINLEIWKRTGGTGSCASVGNTNDSSKATNLTYQLLDASGKLVETLENGKTVYGGITIATPVITIDTSKLTTTVLIPGATYRVVAFEPSNSTLKVEVPFKVPVRNYVDFDSPPTATVPVGQLVMIIASNRDQLGAKTAGAINYTPNIPPGLKVYTDAAGTVAVPATLSTNADGLDTLWATGDPAATADKTYILSLPAPAKLTPTLTFTVPTDRVEIQPPLTRDTLVGKIVAIKLQTVDKTGPQAKPLPYTLKIPAGLKVFSDAAGTVPITSGTTGADGSAIIYATADSTDPVDKSYVLGITTSAPTVTLNFHMPGIDLPKLVSAGIYDDDGDGIGDRIEAVFDRDISAALPTGAAYKWPSTGTAVNVSGADVAKAVAGKNLTLKGLFSSGIQTAGVGSFSAIYHPRKADSVQTVNLDDHIGPIIKEAVISLGKTADTLRIRFSEALSQSGPTGDPALWFAIKRASDGAIEHVAPLSGKMDDDRNGITLIYSNTSASVPRAGNLVRIEDGKGLVADESGNTAGPASRFRVITGDKRSDIETVTYYKLLPGMNGPQGVIEPSLQPTTAVATEVVDRTGRMGHLLKTDLGAYAVGDDFNKVTPAQVVLEYHVSYFTNHGEPVADGQRAVACTDAIFQGDCVTHRGFLFIGWNGTAKDGQKVATGAYVARIHYVIRVAGQVKESRTLDQIWGVLRRH